LQAMSARIGGLGMKRIRRVLFTTVSASALMLLGIPSALAQTPIITSFTPVAGPVGTSVTIAGTNFMGAASVTFNGTLASFTVNSSTQIAATVPFGATTGPIVVAAVGGTGTSDTVFTVLATQGVVVSCPFSGYGGDFLDRGFYVSNYPGTTVDTVSLRYTTFTSGTWTITLTARLDTYDGALVGTSTVVADMLAATPRLVTFDLGAAPVPAGSTITFAQSTSGPGSIFYDVGQGTIGDPSFSGCPGVVETDGTTPPLDFFRRASVGLIITQQTAFRVPIDIKPGSATNPIKLSSTGKIPVAILSTLSFDATKVDPPSVCFGDAEAPAQRDCKAGRSSLQDMNADGRLDLLLHFETRQSRIDPGDTKACLTATTFSGLRVEGCDSIKTL
jgi:IPT/TIG domain